METRSIGSIEATVVGLGCNNFGQRLRPEQATPVVHAALDAGIRYFDTANRYGGEFGLSEDLLREGLGSHRDEVVIATKFGGRSAAGTIDGAHPDHIREAVEASLRRLGTDRIDLYQMHRYDPSVPLEETLGALHELVVAGKVLAIGHSNMPAERIEEADRIARDGDLTRFTTSQELWSLLERGKEQEVIPTNERLGLKVLPYYPLAAGLLTGKYKRGQEADPTWRVSSRVGRPRWEGEMSEQRMEVVYALDDYATEHDRTLLELAWGWLLTHGVVLSVIAGASSPEQVRANVAAADWRLTPEEMAEVDQITSDLSSVWRFG